MAYQLKLTLEGIEPAIWRRLIVPSQFTLYELHQVIQIAMGWENAHMHEFTIKRKRYSADGPDDYGAEDECTTQLQDVIRTRSKLKYMYDYGDSWDHALVVEKTLNELENPLPVCVDGARRGPPEDSGGAWGYAEKLEILKDPRADKHEKAEVRAWLGSRFDPEKLDLAAINRDLRAAFKNWKPSKRKRPRAAAATDPTVDRAKKLLELLRSQQ
jgi:hypothetical protein